MAQPVKRTAAAAGIVSLTRESDHSSTMEWLETFLTSAEYQAVLEAWTQSKETPDGETLFECTQADLREMGCTVTQAKKILLHVAEARDAAAAAAPATDGPPAAAGDGALALGEATPAAGTAAKRGRDGKAKPKPKPKGKGKGKAAAAEAEPAADVEAAAGEEDATPEAAAGAVGARGRPLRAARMTEFRRFSPGDAGGGGRRRSRLAAPAAAAARGGDSDADMFDADEDVDAGAGASPQPQRRQRQQRQQPQLQQVAADDAVDLLGVASDSAPPPEYEGDELTRRPSRAAWAAAARRELPNVLKRLTGPQLAAICEAEGREDWDSKVHKRRVRDRWTGAWAWVPASRPVIARNITRMLLDGGLNGRGADGGTTWEGVDEFVRGDARVAAAAAAYVAAELAPRFAAVPAIADPVALMWRLWARPQPPPGGAHVALGTITVRYARARGPPNHDATGAPASFWDDVRRHESGADGRVSAAYVANLVEDGLIEFRAADAARNYPALVGHLASMHGRGMTVRAELPGDSDGERAHTIVFHLWLQFESEADARAPGSARSAVDGEERSGAAVARLAWLDAAGDDGTPALRRPPLETIVPMLDHLQGSTVGAELDAALARYDDAAEKLEAAGVAESCVEPYGMRTWDAILKTLVEDRERPIPSALKREADAKLAMRLKPYQLAALGFVLGEERARGGGARHQWVRVPLPESARTEGMGEFWVNPCLNRLYAHRSRTAAAHAVGTAGGAGWVALEMGMGKTAVAVAAAVLNPPPAGWRGARAWAPPSAADYMSTVVENMPRGGTLVVVPPTLLGQWEAEVLKTAGHAGAGPGGEPAPRLSVLSWAEGKRTMDCREIAKYDVVLTTPATAEKTSHLSSIYWHRLVFDEPQLGSLLKNSTWWADHRWLTTGTPVESLASTSLHDSLEFLRLGGHDASYKHYPPALAAAAVEKMCRYTMAGRIGGAACLELPPLAERVKPLALCAADAAWYETEAARRSNDLMRVKVPGGMAALLAGLRTDPGAAAAVKPATQMALRRSAEALRATVAGGAKVKTGDTVWNEDREAFDPVYYSFTSKVDALLAELSALKAAEPEAKVLVFTEFQGTQDAVAARLPEVGLQHRCIKGGMSAKKRGEAIAAFQSDPPTRVFLLTAKAGGVGVTLTSATHVFIMEPLLNPSLELQAIGRTRRMGQTRPVTVCRLYAEGTAEERVRALVARRAAARPAGQGPTQAPPGTQRLDEDDAAAAERAAAEGERAARLGLRDVAELLRVGGALDGEESAGENSPAAAAPRVKREPGSSARRRGAGAGSDDDDMCDAEDY